MKRVGVLTGLAAEARVAGSAAVRPSPVLGCAGADVARARAEVERLIAEGAQALLSFGLAGALAPELRPGDVVVADRIVVSGGQTVATDRSWCRAIAGSAIDCGLSMRIAAIAGSDAVIATSAMKRELAGSSGAAAVDMESHVLAVAARRAGLPLMAVRAIADRADQDVPTAALAAIGARGQARLARVIAGLVSSPSELPGLWRLTVCARAGMRSLRRFVRGSPACLFTLP